MSHPVENIMRSTMEQLRQMVDVNTIVGSPVETGNGTVLLPVSKVSMGFVSGGGEYIMGQVATPVKRAGEALDASEGRYPFAGTAAAGMCLTPMAFVTSENGRTRVLPGVKAYLEKTGRLPRCLTFSWAALAAFYAPIRRNEDGTLVGKRGGNEYTVRDDRAAMDFFWENRNAAPEELLRALAGRVDFWGEDLNALVGFVDQAIVDLENIRALDVKDAIRRAMEREA